MSSPSATNKNRWPGSCGKASSHLRSRTEDARNRIRSDCGRNVSRRAITSGRSRSNHRTRPLSVRRRRSSRPQPRLTTTPCGSRARKSATYRSKRRIPQRHRGDQGRGKIAVDEPTVQRQIRSGERLVERSGSGQPHLGRPGSDHPAATPAPTHTGEGTMSPRSLPPAPPHPSSLPGVLPMFGCLGSSCVAPVSGTTGPGLRLGRELAPDAVVDGDLDEGRVLADAGGCSTLLAVVEADDAGLVAGERDAGSGLVWSVAAVWGPGRPRHRGGAAAEGAQPRGCTSPRTTATSTRITLCHRRRPLGSDGMITALQESRRLGTVTDASCRPRSTGRGGSAVVKCRQPFETAGPRPGPSSGKPNAQNRNRHTRYSR